MDRPITARQALRVATRPFHDRVDAAFGGYDLARRDQYAAFLQAQAAAFLPVEAAIDRGVGRSAVSDWAQRRRSDDLIADLAELGRAPDAAPGAIDFSTRAETLGAIYVLEGSRLGGALLSRSVPLDFPRRFIASTDPARWRGLIEVLDSALVSDEHRAAAIDAACRVFALFEDGARRHARIT